MTKSKRFVAFVIFPLLFLLLLILTLTTSEMEISQSESMSHDDVDPNGHLHLTVDAAFDTVHIETTDQPRVHIAIEKRWTSKKLIFQPKSIKWIREMLKDLEFTIEHDHSDSRLGARVEARFNRGREHWQEGLEWLKVEVQVTVPRQYNVTLETVSHRDIHIDNR